MSQEKKKTKPTQINIVKVDTRYELLELVMKHAESALVRRIYHTLTVQQEMKLMFELVRREYYTDELETLIYHMFIAKTLEEEKENDN